MRERPILFSAPMVRALLAGTKTQTRRVVKHRWPHLWQEPWYTTGRVLTDRPTQDGAWLEFRHRDQDAHGYQGSTASTLVPCPYGMPSDLLWVREAWRAVADADTLPPRELTPAHRICFEAEAPHQPGHGKRRPGMFMPRWVSRITLEVTGVCVERLQNINEEDAIAEGIEKTPSGFWSYYDQGPVDARSSYRALWESINGVGSWNANPWVWAITFKRVAS